MSLEEKQRDAGRCRWLKSSAQKLDVVRKELSAEAQNMSNELKCLLVKNQQILTLRAEIQGMHKELCRARSAYECEKKKSFNQMEQRQVLDKNLASMEQEVEKLRADQIRAGNRERGSDINVTPKNGNIVDIPLLINWATTFNRQDLTRSTHTEQFYNTHHISMM
ncbi:hypothetical protein KSP39_PZI008368 [Platanthera zijinensis]|uniref:Uncharacterized protein n=1 Tax=Platanthera zijinensis TaxID=2320716 RepID=A0AAP0G8C1_9ASPA